jgi:hypothetical protein
MNARISREGEPEEGHRTQDDADESFPQVLLGRGALTRLFRDTAVVVSPDGVTTGAEDDSDTEAEEGEPSELG